MQRAELTETFLLAAHVKVIEIGDIFADGLPSIILLEQIRTLDKQRLEKYVGRLSKKHLNELNHAVAISVGLIPAQETLVLCLCKPCADNFRLDGKYDLIRVMENQVRDTCTYCNHRMGVEYELVPK